MTEQADPDRIMQEALGHYFFADNAPALAAVLRLHRKRLQAAEAALSALVKALEKIGSVQSHQSQIARRFPLLLKAHQQTWTDVIELGRLGISDAQVSRMVSGIWTYCLLNVFIERSMRCATMETFDGVQVVRIFGTMHPALASDEIYVTNGHTTSKWKAQLSAGYRDDPACSDLQFPLWVIWCAMRLEQLEPALGQSLSTTRLAKRAPNILYSYGPLGSYDKDIHLDALRDCAAAMNFISFAEMLIANLLTTRIKDKSYTWDYLQRHGISPTAFARAVSVYRRVEAHAIESALSRFRRQQARTGASAAAKRQRPRKNVSKKKIATGTAKRPIPRTKARTLPTGS